MKITEFRNKLGTAIAILAAITLAFASCNVDVNDMIKLDAPTNLVINSISNGTSTCTVSISFSYGGNEGLAPVSRAILGYSTENDSSKAVFDGSVALEVKAGENTATATMNFLADSGTKYYFWLKLTSSANTVFDSDWSDVAEFTYDSLSGTDTEYLARYVFYSRAGEHIKDADEGIAEDLYCTWEEKLGGQYYAIPDPYVISYVYFTFKSVDEENGIAYFYANACKGYYIDSNHLDGEGFAVAIKFPNDLKDKVEINPETNYWRYK